MEADACEYHQKEVNVICIGLPLLALKQYENDMFRSNHLTSSPK